MERTQEFERLLKLFGNIEKPLEYEDEASSPRPPPPASHFAAAASNIALGFGGTLRLVQRLQKLVTRKGLHNDPTAEIEDVTAVFKKDLGQLQREIDALLRHAEANMARYSQRQKHCSCVVDGLKARAGEHTKLFQEALQIRQSMLREQSERRKEALQIRQSVLREQSERRKMFTHSHKGASLAYDSPLFAPPPPPSIPPPISTAPRSGGEGGGGGQITSAPNSGNAPTAQQGISPHAYHQRRPSGGGGTGGATMNGHGGGGASPLHHQQQQHGQGSPYHHQQQQQGKGSSPAIGGIRGTPPSSTSSSGGSKGASPAAAGGGLNPYSMQSVPGGEAGLRRRYAPPLPGGGGGGGSNMMMMQHQSQDAGQRLQNARAIEKTIVELGQTFSKMAGLVAAQSEVVVRIDDDMEMALEDVQKGHIEMENYLRIVKGNRSVIIKVFLIMIAFIIIFVRYF